MKTMLLDDTINLFYKKASINKQADLLADMARRVMFSIIPGPRFDFIAARWAANGVINSVTYGTKAIRDELRYYQGTFPKFENKRMDGWAPIELGKFGKDTVTKYRDFLEIAWLMFDDLKNWESRFGGKPWRIIAETALRLVNLYDKFLHVKKNTDAEEEILKQIIIYLNVFDGLAHNTGGIFDKMSEHESEIHDDDYYENLGRMLKIRDMTELPESVHVFKEIEPLLYPKVVYQDYITEIRSNPEYFKTQDPEAQLKYIRAIKELKKSGKYYLQDLKVQYNYLKEVSQTLDKQISRLQNYTSPYDDSKNGLLFSVVKYIFKEVELTAHSMYYKMTYAVNNNMQELPTDTISSKLLEIYKTTNNDINKFHDIRYSYELSNKSVEQLLKSNLVQKANTVKNILNETMGLSAQFYNLYKDLLDQYA